MTAQAASPTWIKTRFLLRFAVGVLWKGVWTFCVLFWPVIKWGMALEVLWRLLLVIYHRDDPDSHAGWVFILHFLAFSALTYFVTCYKPTDT